MPTAENTSKLTQGNAQARSVRMVTLGMMLLATGLGACTQASQRVDEIARQGAKGVVTETLATRFPQVPKQLITPFTDCIIDNSDANEIRVFAKSAVIGVDDTTVATVRSVLSRPDTVRCLSQNSLGLAGTLG